MSQDAMLGALADEYWTTRWADPDPDVVAGKLSSPAVKAVMDRMDARIAELGAIRQAHGVDLPDDLMKVIVPNSEGEPYRGGVLLRGHAAPFDDGWYRTDKLLERIGFTYHEVGATAYTALWSRRQDTCGQIISYCEGDLSVEVYPDLDTFNAAIDYALTWNKERRHR